MLLLLLLLLLSLDDASTILSGVYRFELAGELILECGDEATTSYLLFIILGVFIVWMLAVFVLDALLPLLLVLEILDVVLSYALLLLLLLRRKY